MRGITKDLDDLVEEAARELAALACQDVEIRFNADRKTGGAWLLGQEGRRALGIRAGYYEAEGGAAPQLAVSIYAGMDRLRNPNSAEPYYPGGPYALVWFDSVDQAACWIQDHAKLSL